MLTTAASLTSVGDPTSRIRCPCISNGTPLITTFVLFTVSLETFESLLIKKASASVFRNTNDEFLLIILPLAVAVIFCVLPSSVVKRASVSIELVKNESRIL